MMPMLCSLNDLFSSLGFGDGSNLISMMVDFDGIYIYHFTRPFILDHDNSAAMNSSFFD